MNFPSTRLSLTPIRSNPGKSGPSSGPRSQPIAPGYLAAARWAADVVHLHHPHPLADLAAVTLPARPLIITHHSDVLRQVPARAVYWPWIRGALKRAAAIVVATRSHMEISNELEAFRHKVRVIPLGVDPQVLFNRFNGMGLLDDVGNPKPAWFEAMDLDFENPCPGPPCP